VDVSTQTVLLCLPATQTVGPCPDGQAPTPTSGAFLAADTVPQLTTLGTVDYVQASEFWGLAFAAIVTVWWTGKIIRSALVFIR
jgi:hypothetical protein